MVIKSLNKIPACYGLPETMDYKTPGFAGHQVCICVGTLREDGVMESFIHSKDSENMTDIQLFEALIKEPIMILTDVVENFIDGKLVKKTMFYVPYYVVDHSIYQPTPNFTNVSFACNVENVVKYEILFVDEQGFGNRYLTLEYLTAGSLNGGISMSFIDIVGELEHELTEILDDPKNDTIFIQEDRITIMFYDKVGGAYPAQFGSISDLMKCITSVRMLDCQTIIKN